MRVKRSSKNKNVISRAFRDFTDKIIYPISEKIKKGYIKLKNFIFKIRKNKSFSLNSRYRRQKIGKSIIASCLLFAIIFLIILVTSILQEGIGELNIEFITSIPSYLHAEKTSCESQKHCRTASFIKKYYCC